CILWLSACGNYISLVPGYPSSEYKLSDEYLSAPVSSITHYPLPITYHYPKSTGANTMTAP
ncbi:MAG: hypothetical protein PHQ23_12525, partial [Candidatus Wallbacteria bacterium]|nr:hypothetical protein [Candidatus Wallbacteria bacterium]